MKIAIATPCLIEGDAVGNDVRGMYVTLKALGHDVKLYAESFDIPEPCTHIDKLSSTDIYIYHHSIYCSGGVAKFKELNCKKIVKYHNITPPEFFPNSPVTAASCQKGLDQIASILEQECDVWVDSEYNGLQLLQHTTKSLSYRVIPPFNQVDMMRAAYPNYRAVLPYNDWNTNIIMVGRVAPNKDVIQGIDAFAIYNKTNPFSRLNIVGDSNGDYVKDVVARIEYHNLQSKVIISGKVPLATLKAYYLIADLLLITSKHEGFCVPMVEAMAFDVPVLSNRHCALPYTGKDVACYTNDNPDDIAVGIKYVLDNKVKFITLGRNKFKETYSGETIASSVCLGINSIEAR